HEVRALGAVARPRPVDRARDRRGRLVEGRSATLSARARHDHPAPGRDVRAAGRRDVVHARGARQGGRVARRLRAVDRSRAHGAGVRAAGEDRHSRRRRSRPQSVEGLREQPHPGWTRQQEDLTWTPMPRRPRFGLIPYGLYVLTAADKSGSRVAAATVNWVTQVAFEPPLVVVGVKTDSHAHPLIKETKAFALNVLGRGQQALAFTFFE